MGIKGLNGFIKKMAPNAIQTKFINDFINKKIAIDSSILIYKYRYASKKNSNSFLFGDYSHIFGFVQKVFFYLKKGIIPIFIFDGIPPDAKKNVIDRRIADKAKIQKKISDLSKKKNNDTPNENTKIDQEINRLSKQITYVTKKHRKECKYIIKLLGIPYIEANGEAETTCAALQKENFVDYIYTEDTDALTFGATKVLKSARELDKIIETDLNVILNEFNFTMDQFIDFCILCGCDYCPTIAHIGPVTAFKLIRDHITIENIIERVIEKNDRYVIPQDFNYKTARLLFNQNPLVGDKKYNFSIDSNKFDKENLEKFIIDELELPPEAFEYIKKNFNISFKKYSQISTKIKSHQTTIDNFFIKKI